MGISDFPNGFKHGVSIRGTSILNSYQGTIRYVNSTGGSDNPFNGRREKPLATWDYANGLCDAGDIIILMPGHAETYTAAADLVLDEAGVTTIGWGVGSLRPTITFTTATTADIDIDAANVTIQNVLFKVGIDSLAAPIDVNATNFAMIGCEFREGNAMQAIVFIDINGGGANACDYATIKDTRIIQLTAGGDAAIELGEVAEGVVIDNCLIHGDFADAGIHNPTGKVLTNLVLSNNTVGNLQTGDHAIELVSACTGFANDNRLYTDTAGTTFDAGALWCNGNLQTNAVDVGGTVSPPE